MTKSVKNALSPAVCISKAWPAFSVKLAVALEKLEEDQYLILTVKNSSLYVQFAAQGYFGLRAETTSNSYLSKPEKLNKAQIAALIALGWTAPTGNPSKATQSNDPDGSPNFFVEFSTPVSCHEVAELAVRTLSEVLRVPHPGSLQYHAFDYQGEDIALPGLGLKLEKQAEDEIESAKVADLLLETLKEFTGINDLGYDADGDVGLSYGDTLILLTLIEDGQYLRIFSPLLHEVEDNFDICTQLNDINASQLQIRYFYRNGTIYANSDIAVAPFVSEIVLKAFNHFCLNVDGVGGILQKEFGGRLVFPESVPSVTTH